jgi:23S rRNA-/tRNA-specific pseudouridylate synthase
MEFHWQTFLNGGVSVLGQSDDGIVALEKPCGIATHPNAELLASKSAIFTCKYSLKLGKFLPGDGMEIFVPHRLDAPVSGVILVALNGKISDALRIAFENRTVTKKYLALLKGHLPNASGRWSSNLTKIKAKNFIRASNGGGTAAITNYRLIGELSWHNYTLSLAELQPLTGRAHQLRLHCAQNGVPIIGDRTYGNFSFNRQFAKLTGATRLLLHSDEITANYSMRGSAKIFHAKSRHSFVDSGTIALTKQILLTL